MEFRLPIPSNWQDFERLCHQLWKEIWCDPNAQLNGRSGQAQASVDVFGQHFRDTGYSGVQCKDKDGRLGRALTKEQLEAECEHARFFVPTLNSFTMATTAPRDAVIQQVARQVTVSEIYPFDVHVWSWDDIESEIIARPNLIENYYSKLRPQIDNLSPVITISLSSPRDQLYAFFARPNISQLFPSYLQSRLVQVLYELGENAFLHGNASKMTLTYDSQALILEDDGGSFDPIQQLDPSKTNARGHVGSFVVHDFLNRFADVVSVTYDRVAAGTTALNRNSFRLIIPVDQIPTPQCVDIFVDTSMAYGRRAAQRLAQSISIPPDVTELVLTVGTMRNTSAFMEFAFQVLQRLPATSRLTISLPRDQYYPGMETWFNDPRVSVTAR